MYVFMYQKNYIKPKLPDEAYQKEFNLMKKKGKDVFIYDPENLELEDFSILTGKTIIYRGEILTLSEYKILENRVEFFGAKMLTTLVNYKKALYISDWFEDLKLFTPKSYFFKNKTAVREYINRNSGKTFFVKDFVKSIKTEAESFILGIDALNDWISDVLFLMGSIDGGICLREVEELLLNTERRYFVMNGTLICVESNFSKSNISVPQIINEIMDIIKIPFYSIDIVLNSKNKWRLLEIGDAQVAKENIARYKAITS